MFEKRKMLAINGNKNRTNVSLKLDSTFEQRKTNYRQAFSHSLLNQKLKYRDNSSCIDQFKSFIGDSSAFLDGVNVAENTQMNESLHSVKGRCTPKITFWKSSWDARTAATILHFNEGPSWYISCYKDLVEAPMHPFADDQLIV